MAPFAPILHLLKLIIEVESIQDFSAAGHGERQNERCCSDRRDLEQIILIE